MDENDSVICFVTEKQKKLLGTKIALLIAKFIAEHYPEAITQVMGDDNPYRAKMHIRYNGTHIRIEMSKGQIEVGPRGVRINNYNGTNASQMYQLAAERQAELTRSIPLADPQAFEKTAQYVKKLIDDGKLSL